MSREDRTVWLNEPPDVRMGVRTARVLAYDTAFDLCLIEFDDDGSWQSHEVDIFVPRVQDNIRREAARSAAPIEASRHPGLDLLAVCLASGGLTALILAWAGAF